MTLPKLNPLALFAICIAIGGIVSNLDLATNALYWACACGGGGVALAWALNHAIGLHLAIGAAVLVGIGVITGFAVDQDLRTVTVGASLGMLVGLTAHKLYMLATPKFKR